MTAEIIFSSIVTLICIAPIIIIGIVQFRSKEPVSFWSGKKPPERGQITDVRAYNHKHGLMWILLGAGYILCFICGLFWSGLAAGLLCVAEVIGGTLVIIARHEKLERMYRRKGGDK